MDLEWWTAMALTAGFAYGIGYAHAEAKWSHRLRETQRKYDYPFERKIAGLPLEVQKH